MDTDQQRERVEEIDETLIEWYLQLSVVERRLNLTTRFGPLDVLCTLHDARGYEELVIHSREILDGDLRVQVIDLETLIEIKRSTGRQRDAMVIPLLEALRRRS